MNRKLIFSVRDIQEKGGLACSETVTESELAQDAAAWSAVFGEVRLSGPCSVFVEFSVGGERLLMEGKVAGCWELSCSRCLTPHKVDFEGALEETYPLAQEIMDIWEDVRQAMILSLPGKSLCSPTCLGLCARCGKELNLGPCGCAAQAKDVKTMTSKR